MKVFISQLMGGKSYEQIMTERDRIWRYLSQKFPNVDIRIIDSVMEYTNVSPIFALGQSISMMADADLVVMAPGWTSGRGTLIEYDVAESYGKPILNLNKVEDFQ